jgi:hypothetical protein
MRWIKLLFFAALLLPFASGCAGCGAVAGAGEECDRQLEEACEDDGHPLVCMADSDGEDRCLNPAGATCDPDADPQTCAPGASCEERDDSHYCLLEESAQCDPEEDFCTDGMVCAETEEGDHRCHAPILVQGVVFDAETLELIEGAHVIAFDEEQSALSDVAVTDENGEYQLNIPATRDEEGTPVQQFFTLRASAQDYQTFPSGLRHAQPIDASRGEQVDGPYIIDTSQTDVALIELPAGDRGHPAIHGRVDIGGGLGGVLVVAEPAGEDPEDHDEPTGISAVSALDGSFTIFNVPADDYDVRGFIADYQIDPEAVTVDDEDVEDVILRRSEDGIRDVTGNLQIVRTSGQTSVILMVASTFDEVTVRGEVPAGLRAPRTGEPDVSGAWTIEGVPAGRYVVMAGFENDDLVRSPDEGIAGTDIVHIEVPSGDGEFNAGDSFKVTEALETFAPGRDAPEGLNERPTLQWGPISNADHYDVVVFDAFGNIVFEETEIPHTGGTSVYELEYTGPFDEGMYYQFRTVAWRGDSPNSTTEVLRGVFFHE